jgi:hypothetical protein
MDGTFPDTLSDLLINESYQGTFGPAATWHAIEHNHVAAVSFREHQAALLEALSEGTTSFDITCMDLMMAVYRGRQRAVLLVGVSPETSHRFSELESLIKSSGWEERLQAKIYIQIIRPILHSAPRRLISPGQALSVEDRPESHGTYGGPIRLGGELYALTCHHVIYDDKVYPELRQIPEGEIEKRTYIPSHRKYEMVLAKRQEDVKAAEKRLAIFEKELSAGVYAQKSDPDKARIEQGLRLSVELAQASLSQEHFEKWRVGTAAYDCGGLTTSSWKGHKRTVDWTLIKLEGSVITRPTVQVPKALGFGAELEIKGLFPDEECDYTALGCHVYKNGQRTLLTEGQMNGVYSSVQLFRKSPNLLTQELMVIPNQGCDAFSLPGDSGAWVCGSSNVIGMVIGGTNSAPYRTYIADMRQIFKEIHRVTKMVPSIPEAESSAPGPFMDVVTLSHCLFSAHAPKIKLLSQGRLVVYEDVATLEVRLPFETRKPTY